MTNILLVEQDGTIKYVVEGDRKIDVEVAVRFGSAVKLQVRPVRNIDAYALRAEYAAINQMEKHVSPSDMQRVDAFLLEPEGLDTSLSVVRGTYCSLVEGQSTQMAKLMRAASRGMALSRTTDFIQQPEK